ncbi:Coatomer subunit zeta-1 [Armadillidium nasatum]|uniref:Coatomer subunit zeta n=1 Tax=Armadillidium nasatum TaxID=96803 RepID=A0A5N5T3D4_9CRUS|nr:Coatomer subunit zeta-1 [Armadillidium nasatum]
MALVSEPTLYVIKGIAILDNDGNRIVAKYYDPHCFSSVKEEKKFEKNLFQKTHRANAEITMLDKLTCLILLCVLTCLYDAVSLILRKNVEKKTLLENLDIILLAIDEICDGGVPLETDPQVVAQRVALRMEETPFNDQTVSQLLLILQTLISHSSHLTLFSENIILKVLVEWALFILLNLTLTSPKYLFFV